MSNTTSIKTTIATTYEGNGSQRDSIQLNLTPKPTGGFGYNQKKWIINSFLNKKINSKHSIQTGLVVENIHYQTKDSLLIYSISSKKSFWGYNNNFSGNTNLLQAYSQWKYKVNELITINSGIHSQYLVLNNKLAFEPRFSLNYKLTESQTLSFGYGLHNQVQPYGMYFYRDKYNTAGVETNKSLGFTKNANQELKR